MPKLISKHKAHTLRERYLQHVGDQLQYTHFRVARDRFFQRWRTYAQFSFVLLELWSVSAPLQSHLSKTPYPGQLCLYRRKYYLQYLHECAACRIQRFFRNWFAWRLATPTHDK
jgi:hypothetical protein